MVIFLKFKLLITLTIIVFSFGVTRVSGKSEESYIIIDPGHGGMDPGCNIGDIKESDVVLEISYKTKEVLEAFGYNVILTRETKESLCEGKFIKKEDMEKRINTANSYNTNFVISIHLNEFGLSEYRGGQVFYDDNNPNSKLLAKSIQDSFKMYLGNTDRVIMQKEHNYLLRRLTVPACIIECGFISNPDELKLLLDDKYQYKLAMAILYGVNAYKI